MYHQHSTQNMFLVLFGISKLDLKLTVVNLYLNNFDLLCWCYYTSLWLILPIRYYCKINIFLIFTYSFKRIIVTLTRAQNNVKWVVSVLMTLQSFFQNFPYFTCYTFSCKVILRAIGFFFFFLKKRFFQAFLGIWIPYKQLTASVVLNSYSDKISKGNPW